MTSQKEQGHLVNKITITLDSYEAVRAVKGRAQTDEKNKIMGLFDFAKIQTSIFNAAKNKDIFAIYGLVRIEEKLKEVDYALNGIDDLLKGKKAKNNNLKMQVEQPKSSRPVVFTLEAGNYVSSVATVILRFDVLVVEVKGLMYLNQMATREGNRLVAKMSKLVRSLLSCGRGFHESKLTAKQIQEGSGSVDDVIKELMRSKFIQNRYFEDVSEAKLYFASYKHQPEFGPASY